MLSLLKKKKGRKNLVRVQASPTGVYPWLELRCVPKAKLIGVIGCVSQNKLHRSDSDLPRFKAT